MALYPAVAILHDLMHNGVAKDSDMQNSLTIRLRKNSHLCVSATQVRMPFPKLLDAQPVPGSPSNGVALGASPRLIAADLPKTGAAQAGSSVTGSTQQRYKSGAPVKG